MMRTKGKNTSSFNQAPALLAALALAVVAPAAAMYDHFSSHVWSFPGGNLIADWSFENHSDELCKTEAEGGFWTECHSPYGQPKSGSFLLEVNTDNVVGTARGQLSDYLACEPGSIYTLSFYVNIAWSERGATNFPVVRLYKGDKSASTVHTGLPYETTFPGSTNGWKRYTMAFGTGSEDTFLRLSLVESNSASGNVSNIFYIDDVILGLSSVENGVTSSRAYGDANGRVDQKVESDGTTDLVAFNEYNPHGQLVKSWLPASRTMGLPSDITAIIVGSRNPGESLEYDFASLDEAYEALSTYAAGHEYSEFTVVPVINVVVEAAGYAVPIGPRAVQLAPLKDKNQNTFQFHIKGVVKNSPEYADLVTRHSTTAQVSGAYSFEEFQAMLAEQYPGETRPFSTTKPPNYSDVVSSLSVPGAGYQDHTDDAGWALVSTLDAPSSPQDYVVPTGEALYVYKWTKDRQGNVTMSWTDRKGRVLKTGKGGKFTTFDYDDYDRLIGSNSPAGKWADREWNGTGLVTATIDPDRGRWEYAYDRQGRQRFINPAHSGTPTQMIAHKYDHLGRIVESGKTAFNWDPSAAANSVGFPTNWLDVGYYFDELNVTEFGLKTGVTLAAMGLDPAKLTHTQGRLVAAYNRNTETAAPGLTTARRKLVASFYAYDAQGRVQYIYRYLGPIENAADRLQKIRFVYDQNNRLESQIVYRNYASSTPSSESFYIYDDMGRVVNVLDKDSKIMASYGYSTLGQVRNVDLYGKFQIGFQYDVRGQLTRTDALKKTAPAEWIFSEDIGYDQKPNPGMLSSPHEARWDGKISGILRKFGRNVANPLVADYYTYTSTGAMSLRRRYTVNTPNPLHPDGSINFAGLNFDWNANYESYTYNEDDDIVAKSTNGSAPYVYQYVTSPVPNHQVKNILLGNRPTGQSMAAEDPGNFQYDARGHLKKDVGLGKDITYGFANDRPILTTVPGVRLHSFYDEGFNRVAQLEEVGGAVHARHVYLHGNGSGVVKEIVERTAAHPLGVFDQTKNNLYARGGIVGIEEEATGRKKLFIKDHLGSLVKVVDESSGDYLSDEELIYTAFGIQQKKVVGGDEPKATGTFTGKQYEELLKTYFFGARSFDPDISLWLSPDPIPSGMNPYAYAKDPASYVDPNGEIAIFFVVLAAALANVAVAYINGDIDNFYDVGKAFTIGGFTAALSTGIAQLGTVGTGMGGFDYYGINQTAARVWGNAGLRVVGSRIPSVQLAEGLYIKPSFFVGTEGLGAGVDVDAIIRTRFIDLHAGLQTSLNASELFSNKAGTEFNYYGGVTAKYPGIGALSAYHNVYMSGETSQSNNLFAYSNKYTVLRYQNDQDLGGSGGGDRWRTAAADIGLKFPGDLTISTGVILYTGSTTEYDPNGGKGGVDLGGTRKTIPYYIGKMLGGNLKETKNTAYSEGSFDKWHSQKAGVLFAGITSGGQTNMIGRNSEAIRDAFQNQLVHKNMGVPYLLPDPTAQPQPFLMYRTHHRNTLY